MVAPVENLTRLRGTVRGRRAHASLAGWDVVSVAVESTEPVRGADLLSGLRGHEVDVAVPRRLLDGGAGAATGPAGGAGAVLSCRARLTPRGVMCEPNPPPGEFDLAPGGAR